MTMLKIADHLSLPLDAVAGTFAILGIRNSGKSHTASVMAEEMLKAGQPIVVYDPTSAWWGLKSSADGKRPAFPVVIFGGEHADVPLEETAGETIATTIVEKRIPAILDCSLLRKGARIRFMTSFAETLYHKNREALHLFLDEAHTVAPQNIRATPEASRLLGAIEDIILQGRRRGLGMTAISPRPATVNANIRSACQTLIAMRVGSGKLDRKAIEEWIEAHGDAETAKEMLKTLASLPKGDGWVWNPAADIFKRVHFRQRETFDSSATPKVGEKIITPQRMARVDLEALGEAIRATVEKAKADDPNELRRQIAELRKQLAAKPSGTEPPEFREFMTNAAATVKELQAAVKERDLTISAMGRAIATAGSALGLKIGIPPPVPEKTLSPVKNGQSVARPVAAPPPAATHRPAPRATAGHRESSQDRDGGVTLGKCERAVLSAFHWLKDEPANAAKVAFYSDYSASSSGFTNALGRLRTLGLLRGWQITADGEQEIGPSAGEKPSGQQLRDWLRRRLGKCENMVLDALLNVYPNRISDDEISMVTGYSMSSSGFTNALGRLRTIEAAEGYARDGGTKAAEIFFKGGVWACSPVNRH